MNTSIIKNLINIHEINSLPVNINQEKLKAEASYKYRIILMCGFSIKLYLSQKIEFKLCTGFARVCTGCTWCPGCVQGRVCTGCALVY